MSIEKTLQETKENMAKIDAAIDFIEQKDNPDLDTLRKLKNTKEKYMEAYTQLNSPTDEVLYNEYKDIRKTQEIIKEEYNNGELGKVDYESEIFIQSRRRDFFEKSITQDKLEYFSKRYDSEINGKEHDLDDISFEDLQQPETLHAVKDLNIIEDIPLFENKIEESHTEVKENILYQPDEDKISEAIKLASKDVNEEDEIEVKSQMEGILSEYDIYDLYDRDNIKKIDVGDLKRTIYMKDNSVINEDPTNIKFDFSRKAVDPLLAASRVISMAKQKEWETINLNSSNPAVLAVAYEMAIKEGLSIQPLNKEQESMFKALHSNKRLDQYAPFTTIEGKSEQQEDTIEVNDKTVQKKNKFSI